METNFASLNEEQCAERLLEVLPSMMRRIRAHFYRKAIGGLSLQELKALIIVARVSSPTVTTLCEELQHSAPMASKLVASLVKQRLIKRKVDREDRRRVFLELTEAGRLTREQAHQAAKESVAELLKSFTPEQRGLIGAVMELLKTTLA